MGAVRTATFYHAPAHLSINFFTPSLVSFITPDKPRFFDPPSIKMVYTLINKVWIPAQNGEIKAKRMAPLP
jgi:hypothetical protein